MRLTIAAVGRLKAGPEATLVDDYVSRAGAVGRTIGFGAVSIREIDERKARDRDAQAARLLAEVPDGALTIALDERGRTLTSPAFADRLGQARDTGTPAAVFLIGGADGHGAEVTRRADLTLSFGTMVWPHMLVRVMVAEQLFRAVSILAGTPYHRV